jgi:hypothetical protein
MRGPGCKITGEGVCGGRNKNLNAKKDHNLLQSTLI